MYVIGEIQNRSAPNDWGPADGPADRRSDQPVRSKRGVRFDDLAAPGPLCDDRVLWRVPMNRGEDFAHIVYTLLVVEKQKSVEEAALAPIPQA